METIQQLLDLAALEKTNEEKPLNAYEERLERYEALAAKARKQSDSVYQQARSMSSCIPYNTCTV